MSEKRIVWNSRTPEEEIEHKALMIMLRSGLATVGEAARLCGISRQRMWLYSRNGPNPMHARQKYLKETLRDLIDQMS